MATVRFSRGRWVADFCDTNKRRRIERPRGHFENLTSELRAAQALLADRVAEVADGLVHEGCHMLPRKGDPVGDRLASLVFGNKMETDRDAANRARKSVSGNIYESMS